MPGILRAVRILLAVAGGTFVAGAAVNVRLQARIPGSVDWPHAAAQGLEVMAWFTLFAWPATVVAHVVAARRRPTAARRLLVAFAGYGIAVALFVLAFLAVDAAIVRDGLVHVYLLAGSLAGALADGAARVPPPADMPTPL